MAALERTERRVRLLTACRDGQVQWDPAGITDGGLTGYGQSGWIIYGMRVLAWSPDAAELDYLSLHLLTHSCDSQEITPDGEALLREWTR